MQSLKEISNKVIRTTDTIVTVLRTMWTLKVSKESNSTLEQELIEINKSKVPIQPANPYVSLEKMKVSLSLVTKISIVTALAFVIYRKK